MSKTLTFTKDSYIIFILFILIWKYFVCDAAVDFFWSVPVCLYQRPNRKICVLQNGIRIAICTEKYAAKEAFLNMPQFGKVALKLPVRQTRYVPDGLYPDNAGYKRIARCLKEYMR